MLLKLMLLKAFIKRFDKIFQNLI